eukprot:7377405-Prymnesium_polylepis.1
MYARAPTGRRARCCRVHQRAAAARRSRTARLARPAAAGTAAVGCGQRESGRARWRWGACSGCCKGGAWGTVIGAWVGAAVERLWSGCGDSGHGAPQWAYGGVHAARGWPRRTQVLQLLRAVNAHLRDPANSTRQPEGFSERTAAPPSAARADAPRGSSLPLDLADAFAVQRGGGAADAPHAPRLLAMAQRHKDHGLLIAVGAGEPS